jgi:hypothetical protein
LGKFFSNPWRCATHQICWQVNFALAKTCDLKQAANSSDLSEMAEAPTLRLGLRVEATSKGANNVTWHL